MSHYHAPLQEMSFVINHLHDLPDLARQINHQEAQVDLLEAILEQANKLFHEVWAPLNRTGDAQGVSLTEEGVTTASGFIDAYQQFCQGGWNGLYFPEEFGGQGLPFSFAMPVTEMAQAANMALGLCPMLTAGAIETLHAYGTPDQKNIYLNKLIAGTWSGTMNLTEPHAGTDLGLLKTTATPCDDYYLIKGQKIFITWGDHDMTENIVHLVLARLPDALPGVKGISLFLVPKIVPDERGNLGQLNDMKALSVEHKLGIHASPTCVMSYGDKGGARGYLVGEPHKGLRAIFTMMNNERLVVGLQGVGLSEAAYQQARNYAKERVQGKAPSHEQTSQIIHHPDVRRMLMTMRSLTEASRAICYLTAKYIDLNHYGVAVESMQKRIDLMIPIVKAWCTEVAEEATSLGIQIHGGMGFIEETGAAQYYRDARILSIYEGTNGIQALDLVGRKILLDKAATLTNLLQTIQADMQQHQASLSSLQAANMQQAMQLAQHVQHGLLDKAKVSNTVELGEYAGSISFDYLMLLGYLCGGWQMMRALTLADRCEDPDFAAAKRITCAFYLEHLLPRALAYGQSIKGGVCSTMGLDVEQF